MKLRDSDLKRYMEYLKEMRYTHEGSSGKNDRKALAYKDALEYLENMIAIAEKRKKRKYYTSPSVDYWRKIQMEEKEDEREAKRRATLRV